jgi:hypothetical protein
VPAASVGSTGGDPAVEGHALPAPTSRGQVRTKSERSLQARGQVDEVVFGTGRARLAIATAYKISSSPDQDTIRAGTIVTMVRRSGQRAM